MKNIAQLIQKILLNKFLKAYIIDISNDKVYIYHFKNNTLVNNKNTSYSEFLANLGNIINNDELSELTNNLSISHLTEVLQNGKNKVTQIITKKEETGETRKYLLDISLVEHENQKLIVVMEEENNLSLQENILNNSNEIKTHEMIDNISDSLLKIYNIFNNGNNTPEVKNIGNYINTILSDLTRNYPEFNKSFQENAISLSSLGTPSLLIVDDDMITRNLIKKIFADEYNILMATNGEEAIKIIEENNAKSMFETRDNIVGIFLDLVMPGTDGFGVLDYLNKNNYLNKIPVAIISGDYSKETRNRVYNYHIADMLEKPFNTEIIKHRINNLINLYKSSNSLNEMILNQYSDLKNIIDTIISAYKYDYGKNITNIQKYTEIIGQDIIENHKEYNLDEFKLNKIKEAACYYDIGYYAIPRVIYSKATSLTMEEADIIKNYPIIGSKIVKYGLKDLSDNAYIDYAYEITKYYHERYDGSGYPEGLKGESIPISASIVSLAVEYNNLRHTNNNNDEIIKAISSKSGTKFNPKLIESLQRVANKLERE